MTLKPGSRLRSNCCSTEIVVVRAPAHDVDLRCGGQPVIELTAPTGDGTPTAPFDGGTLVGKRYVDPEGSLELLCTKAGTGSLSVGDDVLQTKSAAALPASD